MSNLRFITAEEISKVLKYEDLIPIIEMTLRDYSEGKGTTIMQPSKTLIDIKEHNGFCLVMPCYSQPDKIIATKLVTVFPDNVDIPSHDAAILLFDSTNGKLLSLMDGVYITAMRTAAVSAVATKFLSPLQPQTLAILGAGVQARSHYKALTFLYNFKKVKVWSRRRITAETLSSEIGAEACDSIEEAVLDADIIVTVTTATQPILKAEWVKKGAHINAVGACKPTWQELDPALMQSSMVYVEDTDIAKNGSGDIINSKAEIYAEIGEVIAGSKVGYRSKTTIFKSLGMAIEDSVSAKLVYQKFSN